MNYAGGGGGKKWGEREVFRFLKASGGRLQENYKLKWGVI